MKLVKSMFEFKTIRCIRKTSLPIEEGQRVDLARAFDCLGPQDFVTSYEPEVSPCGLYVRLDGISFRVFGNGTVVVYGLASVPRQRQAVSFFWENFLKNFVV